MVTFKVKRVELELILLILQFCNFANLLNFDFNHCVRNVLLYVKVVAFSEFGNGRILRSKKFLNTVLAEF